MTSELVVLLSEVDRGTTWLVQSILAQTQVTGSTSVGYYLYLTALTHPKS